MAGAHRNDAGRGAGDPGGGVTLWQGNVQAGRAQPLRSCSAMIAYRGSRRRDNAIPLHDRLLILVRHIGQNERPVVGQPY